MKQRLFAMAACLSLAAVSLAVYTPVVAAQSSGGVTCGPAVHEGSPLSAALGCDPPPPPKPKDPEEDNDPIISLVKTINDKVVEPAVDAVQSVLGSYGRSVEVRGRAQYAGGAEVTRLAVETETGRNVTGSLVGLGVSLIPGGGAASRGAGTAVRSGLAARAQQAAPGAIAGVGTSIGLSHVAPRSGGTVANRGNRSSSSSSGRGSSGSPAIGSPRTSSGSSPSSSQSNSGGQSSTGSTK